MSKDEKKLTPEEVANAKGRRLVGMRLQEIESNPLDADQIAMFEMFEREGWSFERRAAYIRERAKAASLVPAAE